MTPPPVLSERVVFRVRRVSDDSNQRPEITTRQCPDVC